MKGLYLGVGVSSIFMSTSGNESDDGWGTDDDWAQLADELEAPPAPARAPKRAHVPRTASGDARKLDFCTDTTPDKVMTALENRDMYKDARTFTNLINFLVFRKSNDGKLIWKSLKPYHANLLAYQVAAGLQAKTLTDVRMIRACYTTIVRIMESHVPEGHAVYTQWVGRESVEEFTNIAIIFEFLRKHDDEIARTAGPGKLP